MLYKNITKEIITRDRFNELKRLLESTDNPIESHKDTTITGFEFMFSNNFVLVFDICCGGNNYYENCFMTETVGGYLRELITYDCLYTLPEVIEVEYNGDTYLASFTITD